MAASSWRTTVAGGRDRVQAAQVRELHHRRRRDHFAHGDRRAQPRHPLDRRAASRAPAGARERASDRRWHAWRGHRQSRRDRSRRIPPAPGRVDLERQKLRRLKTTRAATLDGTRIELHANIELPGTWRSEGNGAAASDCFARSSSTSIGATCLRKTNSSKPTARSPRRWTAPGHHTHVRPGRRQGARRHGAGFRQSRAGVARHPALPRRAADVLRPVASHPPASAFGKIKILVPMLSGVYELNQTLHLIDEARRSLDQDGIATIRRCRSRHDRDSGGSAVARIFTRKLDFLSIARTT